MITDEDVAVKRVIHMVEEHQIKAVDGSILTINPDTVCVHGDGIKAVAFVKKIHSALDQEGIEVKSM